MLYLKMPNRYNIIDNGAYILDENTLVLSFFKDNYTFEDVKNSFNNISDITIYDCIEEEEEPEEFVSRYYDRYTNLKSIEYDFASGVYKVTLIMPDEIEERFKELEEVINYLLMGGEE